MKTTTERRAAFRALHERPGIFVMPNPWDAGTAKILADAGFEAIATASAALAASLGRSDGAWEVSREQALSHAKVIVDATDLPVNGDLENGFGNTPDEVAETIVGAIHAGLAGCSIEDSTGVPEEPLYDFPLAVERIRAAREAIDAEGVDFVLTARAECFLTGHEDPLNEVIRRLTAYEAAGADVVYAPGLATTGQVRAVVDAATVPVNVLAAVGKEPLSIARLAELGVKRVSLGPRLAQAAWGGFLRAVEELKESGTFGFMADAARLGDLYETFGKVPDA